MREAVLVSAAAITLLFACGDEDGEEEVPKESPTASARPATTPTATGIPATLTLAPTPIVTATPYSTPGDPDFARFRDFAGNIQSGIGRGDLGLLLEIAERVRVTCQGDEQLGPCAGKPPGEVVEGIPGSAWRSDASGVFRDAEYAENLSRYFGHAQSNMTDEYGSGAARLYALASSAGSDGVTVYQAITTAIEDQHHSTGYPIDPPARVALVFNLVVVSGQFRFTGERYAAVPVTAGDWLSGTCAECYSYWERWG